MQISHTNNNLVFRSQEDSRFEEYLSESKVEDELLLLWRLVVDLVLLSLLPSPRIDLQAAVDGGRRGEGRPAGKGREWGERRPAGAVGDGRRGAGVGERGGRSGSSPTMRRRPTLSAGTMREGDWGNGADISRRSVQVAGKTLGKTGNTRTRGTPTWEKHLPACFTRDTTFLVAFVISTFDRIYVWLGLWLISHKSHNKSLTKQALCQPPL
jgi:hypothetical protein